ncbi:MAG: hypothetical protein HYV33_04650 [Candidatus Kerfeldbacteria bacterium]|nr:hypothetical protein [Candidatus Kerfeldbacteria bacterium]
MSSKKYRSALTKLLTQLPGDTVTLSADTLSKIDIEHNLPYSAMDRLAWRAVAFVYQHIAAHRTVDEKFKLAQLDQYVTQLLIDENYSGATTDNWSSLEMVDRITVLRDPAVHQLLRARQLVEELNDAKNFDQVDEALYTFEDFLRTNFTLELGEFELTIRRCLSEQQRSETDVKTTLSDTDSEPPNLLKFKIDHSRRRPK